MNFNNFFKYVTRTTTRWIDFFYLIAITIAIAIAIDYRLRRRSVSSWLLSTFYKRRHRERSDHPSTASRRHLCSYAAGVPDAVSAFHTAPPEGSRHVCRLVYMCTPKGCPRGVVRNALRDFSVAGTSIVKRTDWMIRNAVSFYSFLYLVLFGIVPKIYARFE